VDGLAPIAKKGAASCDKLKVGACQPLNLRYPKCTS